MPLAIPELRTAASFLRQTKILVECALDYFRGENAVRAARLGDISQRITDEREAVERRSPSFRTGAERMAEEPAEQPANLLWAIDEIIIALQHFREKLKRFAAEAKKF
jgi:hypothetical protein